MQTITSAYANKMLKSLEEDKAFWVNKEAASSTYVAAINEEPVIPEYDYSEVASMITAIDEKIAIIKHALNVTNATAKVQVGNSEMSIDTILIKMAQLNKRKGVLDQIRTQHQKSHKICERQVSNQIFTLWDAFCMTSWVKRAEYHVMKYPNHQNMEMYYWEQQEWIHQDAFQVLQVSEKPLIPLYKTQKE